MKKREPCSAYFVIKVDSQVALCKGSFKINVPGTFWIGGVGGSDDRKNFGTLMDILKVGGSGPKFMILGHLKCPRGTTLKGCEPPFTGGVRLQIVPSQEACDSKSYTCDLVRLNISHYCRVLEQPSSEGQLGGQMCLLDSGKEKRNVPFKCSRSENKWQFRHTCKLVSACRLARTQ